MARPSITHNGTPYEFLSLRGEVQTPGQIVEDITRPGVDGHAWRRAGLRGRPFDLVGERDVSNASAAKSDMLAMQSMRGRVVTLYDENGSYYGEVTCLDVEKLGEKRIAGAIGGITSNATILLSVRFTLQLGKVP